MTYKNILEIYSNIGISGKPLRETHPMTSTFEEKAGIYGWVVEGRIVYIGKTENFNNRIAQHVSELNRVRSQTGKYNKGVGPHEIEIVILFEIEGEVDQTLLSIAEQIAIDASGGVSRLWNDRNEATRGRVVKNIRRN